MYVNVKALVIKETKKGENGKLLTVITPSHGALTISAKGGVNVSSRFFASCQLYAYSDMTLFKRGSYYTLIEAKLIDVFFEVNTSLTTLSLACWLCECTSAMSIADEEQGELFRLLLNSLWYLSKHPEQHNLVKAVFEFRAMCIAGFCPEFRCASCGEDIGSEAWFNTKSGEFVCGSCQPAEGFYLSSEALTFLAYISACPPKNIFNNPISDEALLQCSKAIESFFIGMTDINIKKLQFYKNITLL